MTHKDRTSHVFKIITAVGANPLPYVLTADAPCVSHTVSTSGSIPILLLI